MKITASLRSVLCIAALATSLCAISARGQELVVNGGFETGDFNGWTLVDSSDLSLVGPTSGVANGLEHSGTYYANLGAFDTVGTLSQTFNTIAGQQYTLSLWLANDSSGTGPQFFNILFGGATIASFDASNYPFDPHLAPFTTTPLTFTVTATTNSTVLQFESQNDDGFWRIDDVSVTAAIPEPSTVSFAVLGLGILGLTWYGRAKARRA